MLGYLKILDIDKIYRKRKRGKEYVKENKIRGVLGRNKWNGNGGDYTHRGNFDWIGASVPYKSAVCCDEWIEQNRKRQQYYY